MANIDNKFLKKLVPGVVGLLIAGLLVTILFSVEHDNREITKKILAAQWCGYQGKNKPFLDDTPECQSKEAKIPLYEKDEERNDKLIDLLSITSAVIAAFSGAFIMFTVFKKIFSERVMPVSRRLKTNYEVDQAVKQIEKYQKLLNTGVLTQEQYDRKVEELKKLIAE